MAIKNNLSIFFESIYNLFNHSSNIISDQFQIIYIINTESKFDIQNKTINNIIINNIIKLII